MKALISISILLLSLNSWSVTILTIDQLTAKVKSQNLTVLQNAEKVYQAKLSIDEARLNLLPKLNLWSLSKVAMGPSALLDVVQDIAPFLVPANWFRLKETEILYQAQREGFRALQANEIYAARSLYLKVLLDQEMYASLEKYQAELLSIKNIVEDRVILGMEKPELAREIQVQYLKINEDVSQLKLLVSYEKSTLNQALGLPVDEDIRLVPVNFNFIKLGVIDYKTWEKAAVINSPELKQYDQFIRVLPKIKKEIYFSFLGVPTLSRGTAGGIFDGIPTSQGLGFATATQIAIVKTQGKILEMQKNGIAETLKRQVLNVSRIHNYALDLYPSQKERLALSDLNFKSLKQKLILGEKVSFAETSVVYWRLTNLMLLIWMLPIGLL